MRTEPNESELLIEFARAASKAQEIERILRDSLIAFHVDKDTKKRSFEEIAKKIDRMPLGSLQEEYFKTVGKDMHDQGFKKMFYTLNDERIFLMHKFFLEFPVTILDGNEEAKIRLIQIDETLGNGLAILRRAFENAIAVSLKIHPAKFRDFLRSEVEHRKKAKASE